MSNTPYIHTDRDVYEQEEFVSICILSLFLFLK